MPRVGQLPQRGLGQHPVIRPMSVSAAEPGITNPTRGKADITLPHVSSEQILLAGGFKSGQILLPKDL